MTILRKYLSEIAIGISMLAIAGWLNFLTQWAQVQYAVAQAEAEIEAHVDDSGAHTRSETVGAQRERLDKIDNRLDRMESEQRTINEKVIESLGRIEGRLGTTGR